MNVMDVIVPLVVAVICFFLVIPQGQKMTDKLVKRMERPFDDWMLRRLKGKPIIFNKDDNTP